MEDDFYSRGLSLPRGQQKPFWSGREGESKDKSEKTREKNAFIEIEPANKNYKTCGTLI